MAEETKNYQVIVDKAEALNLNKEVVKTYSEGDTVTGVLVIVSGNPYIETPDGNYVSTKGLAEQLDQSTTNNIAAKVKSSNKKLLYALAGAGLGFGVAYLMKKETKAKIIYTIIGIAAGLLVEYTLNKKAESKN